MSIEDTVIIPGAKELRVKYSMNDWMGFNNNFYLHLYQDKEKKTIITNTRDTPPSSTATFIVPGDRVTYVWYCTVSKPAVLPLHKWQFGITASAVIDMSALDWMRQMHYSLAYTTGSFSAFVIKGRG